MYTISDISKQYGILKKTLRTRVFTSKLGTLIDGIKYFTKEEKDRLVDPSLHKVGRKKNTNKRINTTKERNKIKKEQRETHYSRLREFKKKLEESVRRGEDIKELCERTRKNLEKQIPNITPFYAQTLFSLHRTAIFNMLQCRPSFNYFQVISEAMDNFKIPLELSELTKKLQQENLIKKLSAQKEIPFPLIKFQKFLKNLFFSSNFKDNLIGVFLVTGRRKYEILSKGIFSLPSPSESKLPSLHMSGVLKKRTNHKFPKNITFPVLYKPHKILEIIKRQREKEKVSYLTLLRYLKSKYPELGTKLHELRSLYGVYSYRLFVRDKKMNINLWLNKVLGHENKALNASFHYSYFKE